MGQAGVDLPDPLGARPSPGSADTGLPDDAAADDLLSQLAGEEIDRLLAAADVESEPPPAAPRVAPVPAATQPRITPPAPAARTGRPVRRSKDRPATSRPPKASASAPPPTKDAKPGALSPGAHNVIAPLADESDAAVRAELDDAFEQLAGGAPPTAPAPGHAATVAPVEPQGGVAGVAAEGSPGELTFGAPPEEPLGALLEQLTAVRAEVEAEVRAEAAAEARSAAAAGGAGADAATFPHLPALLPEDDNGPLNLVVPEPPRPADRHSPALVSDESLEAEPEGFDFGEPTSADERAGLATGGLDAPAPAAEAAPVRPAMPIPQDEETFLAEDPASDGAERTPLAVRVLEWVNRPLAAFPEAVRQAIGKVAILTLINAILVLIYVLLVRG